MKYTLSTTLIVITAISVFAAGLDSIVEPDARVEKLADGFKFTEGATVNAAGEIFFTDQPNNAIYRWSREHGVRLFMQPAGRSNGMCFMSDGSLLACADEEMELWSIAEDGIKRVLLKGYQGRAFNGPNDVWAHPQGGCYFTDPFYKRAWWSHNEPPQGSQQVYYLAEGAQQAVRVTENLEKPNGIVGTVDGRTLFVADIAAHKTWKYTLTEDFKLTDKRLFCAMGSDGMTIDRRGNLYLTGSKGVYVFDSSGAKIGVIEVPESWSANLCIGGSDKNLLFITAKTAIYAIALKVEGTAQGK